MKRLGLTLVIVGTFVSSASLYAQVAAPQCDSGMFWINSNGVIGDLAGAVKGLESCSKNTSISQEAQKWLKHALPECKAALAKKLGDKNVTGNWNACPDSLKHLKEALKKSDSAAPAPAAKPVAASAPAGPSCNVGDVADKLLCIAAEKLKKAGPGQGVAARQKMNWAKEKCKPVTKKEDCDKALINLRDALKALP